VFDIPPFAIESKIINFKQFSKVWSMLPSYVQIRKPHKFFSSAEDGARLQTMVDHAHKFIDE
jgi:hypothetical protein